MALYPANILNIAAYDDLAINSQSYHMYTQSYKAYLQLASLEASTIGNMQMSLGMSLVGLLDYTCRLIILID